MPGSLLVPAREAAFLDVDFAAPRPELVTRLLALACLGTRSRLRDDAPLWQLSVASRLKRLLQIAGDTLGLVTLSVRPQCPAPECGQLLEIELPLADLDALHDESTDADLLHFPTQESGEVAFRRPSGEDLRQWREASAPPEAVLRSLVVTRENAAAPAALPAPEECAEAFAEFDGLVAFQVTTLCPHCGREGSHAIDLETLALNQLAGLQQRLFRENHRLARAYGWSESDILQVPRVRRLRYLAQVEEGT